MKYKATQFIILFLSIDLWIGVYLFLSILPSSSGSVAHASSLVQPIPTPSAPSPDARLQFFGAIIVAIIGGIFLVYQVRKTKAAQDETQRVQREKQDLQHRLDAAQYYQQLEDDTEKAGYDDWLVARREAQVEERKRRREAHTAAQHVMVQAQTSAEREAAYRKAIHADPNISQLQILDMSHPMEVSKVYVRLRVHQEVKLGYEIEASLRVAEAQGDPNALLKGISSSLEKKTSAAMTPEDALKKYPRCVVLGDPGAGKSTLLKHLTLKAIERQLPNLPDLPIHIALSDFATSSKQDLITFAAQRWDERYHFPEDEARSYIESRLEDGSAILLLDALDETVIGGSDKAAQESYSNVIDAIGRVATSYPKAPIIVTARKAGYYQRAHLSGFTELEVLDFRPEEIKEFIKNWFTYHPAPPKHATADELNTQLEQNPRMLSLAANPLLLCLIVLVYESHQALPEKRAELYKQCVDTLLDNWDTSRDIRRRRRFRSEHKKQLLMEVAWHFHQQGERYFTEEELLKVIGNFLLTVNLLPEESKAVLNEIEAENGLLKEQAHGWHGFLHLTLQEYFVAQYAANISNGLDELLKHVADPWWEEVFMLYAGSIYDASPLIQQLLAQEKRQRIWKDIFHTSLLLAGRCLVARPRLIQTALRKEIISRLFDLLKKTSYFLIVDQIVEILMGIEGNDARGQLLSLLKDTSANSLVRWHTANALGQLGDPTVIPDLLSLLKDTSDDSFVRWNAASALGQLGDTTVIPDLLSLLKDTSEDIYVREHAAQALGQLGDLTVIPDLLSLLKDKSEASTVRDDIASALGQLSDLTIIPDLLSLLKDTSEDNQVRWNTARALGQLSDLTVIPDLLSLLKDTSEASTVRDDIASALGQLGDPTVIPNLLSLLKDTSEDIYVRRELAWAIGKLGQYEVASLYVPRLMKATLDYVYLDDYDILDKLIYDYPTIRAFAQLLKYDNISTTFIYQTLWNVAPRKKVRILMLNLRFIKFIRVVKEHQHN